MLVEKLSLMDQNNEARTPIVLMAMLFDTVGSIKKGNA